MKLISFFNGLLSTKSNRQTFIQKCKRQLSFFVISALLLKHMLSSFFLPLLRPAQLFVIFPIVTYSTSYIKNVFTLQTYSFITVHLTMSCFITLFPSLVCSEDPFAYENCFGPNKKSSWTHFIYSSERIFML